MANSDIENFVADVGSSPRVSAPAAGPIRDLKSLISRQERAPLEISNASNRVQTSHQVLGPAANKTRDDGSRRTPVEQYSTRSIGNLRHYDESVDLEARARRWGMLSAGLDEDRTYSYFHGTVVPEGAPDSEFDRRAVKAVQDSFRELCAAPKQLEDTNFFVGIIDVDREAGFGEDEDFAGDQAEVLAGEQDEDFAEEQNESVSESWDALKYQPVNAREEGTADGHRRTCSEEDILTTKARGSEQEVVEFRRGSTGNFVRSSSTFESCTVRTYRMEDPTVYPSFQRPDCRRSVSAEDMNLSSDDRLNAEEFGRQSGDSSVDFEAGADQDRLTVKSESGEEGMVSVDRDGEWEMESREVNLEDEVGTWKEQERESAQHVRNDYPSQNKQENIDEAIRDIFAEMRQENESPEEEDESVKAPVKTSMVLAAIGKRDGDNNSNPYSLLTMTSEDLLREADWRADRERKRVDDVVRSKEEAEQTLRHQQMRWSDTEKQLESRINSLEMQHSRLSDILGDTATALTLEKERRKESRIEVDRILEMLKKERKSHQETLEKLSTCVNSLMKLRGNLAMQKSRSAEDGGPSYLQVVETVLRDMDRELQINLNHLTRKSSDVDYHSMDIDELGTWKQQRDALELERDKVEENMTLLLRRTRERHGEMEVLWLERETLLEQKIGCLEVELQHSQMKQRRKEAELLTERHRLDEELEKCRRAWGHERAAWEATVREREQRFGEQIAMLNLLPKVSQENCVVEKVWEDVREENLSNVDEADKICNQKAGLSDMVRHGRACNEKVGQFCVDVGSLVSGMEAGVESVTDDSRSKDCQMEMMRVEWNEVKLGFKKERQEMEKRVTDTLALVEHLKTEISAKEVQMDEEREQSQRLLLGKVADVEKLKSQLKSKEHDMEVTVQKFMDEVRLIDKEVEKERKEREQVMELHFASKRKVVTDMKEREEKWEKEVESINHELDHVKAQLRSREKELEELKRSSVRAPSERERQLTKSVSSLQHEKDALAAELSKEKGEVRKATEEMLVKLWNACEEEQIQAAVAKKLGPGKELSPERPMWESLWHELCSNKETNDNKKSLDWEVAVGNMARFDKQISDAMDAIDNLRDELKMKEDQLLEAKADREREWEEREKEWAHEKEQVIKSLESQQQVTMEWQARQQDHLREKEAMEKFYKVQQDESAEAISNLQGAVRELEWNLRQRKSLHAKDLKHEGERSVVRRGLMQSAAKTGELVKVHASYLEEVDQYILELETKMKDSEKNNLTRGAVDALKGRRQSVGDPQMNLALLQIEKELFSTPESKGYPDHNSSDDDGGFYPRGGTQDWNISGVGLRGSVTRVPRKRTPRPLERNMCLTLNGLATLAQDTWPDGEDTQLPLWHVEGQNSFGSWMSQRGLTEDLYASHEFPTSGLLALPASSPTIPSRRQQKWVVDATWLEQVRKEHTWLRQQLEIERQRVAALGRVEADNRWIEAAIIRALELKRASDTKAADMQRKVNVMEVLMSKKVPIRTGP